MVALHGSLSLAQVTGDGHVLIMCGMDDCLLRQTAALNWCKAAAPRSDASGSVQTCIQLCVIVRENVTEKTTLNSLLGDSEINYTASYSLMFNIRFDVLVRQKQKHKNQKKK